MLIPFIIFGAKIHQVQKKKKTLKGEFYSFVEVLLVVVLETKVKTLNKLHKYFPTETSLVRELSIYISNQF